MFEREIKFIIDFNINKVKRLGAFFSLESLNKVNIHPSIIQYISAELDYLIYIDRQRILQKSAFDYSGSEISNYFSLIAKEIKKNKLLPFEDIKRIIQQSVTFNVNFLLRPKWTLTKFIFDTEEYRTIDEIKIFLNYTYFYTYFKELSLILLDKKNVLSVNLKDFNSLIDKIQNELLDTQLQAIIDDGLFAMSDFLNLGEINKQKLTIETIEIFLKEKDLLNYIYKVRKILSVDPKQKYEVSEFQSALYSDVEIELEENKDEPEIIQAHPDQLDIFELEKKSEEPSNLLEEEFDEILEIETTENNVAQIPTVEEIPTIVAEEPQTINTEEVENYILENKEVENIEESFEETFRKMVEKASLETEQIESEIENEFKSPVVVQDENDIETKTTIDEISEMIELIDKKNQAIETTELEIADESQINHEIIDKDETESNQEILESAELEKEVHENKNIAEVKNAEEFLIKENVVIDIDIFNFFSSKETMKIINAIFNNDSVDFINTMEKLTECRNIDEANEIMKSVFYSYKINPFSSKEAALLQEKVKQYFNSKN